MTDHSLLAQVAIMRDGLSASGDTKGADTLVAVHDLLAANTAVITDMGEYITLLLESDTIKGGISYLCFADMGIDSDVATIGDFPEKYHTALHALANIASHREGMEEKLNAFLGDDVPDAPVDGDR